MASSLKDVARLAGVSVRTVSNVVNDAPYVAGPTREKVQRALEELGYRPNLAARTLRQGRSGLLGLVVPEIDSPYFGELAGCSPTPPRRAARRWSSTRPGATPSESGGCSPDRRASWWTVCCSARGR
jgi:transcriptional regulator with XRE-family HTH domain